MDINDISINSLIREAALWQDFDWCNNGTFECHCGELTATINMPERDIVIKDEDSGTKITFRHVHEKPFNALLDGLLWDELKEAA